jgi:hypothetical protein
MTWHVPLCNRHIRFLVSPLVEYHPGRTFQRDSITAMSLRVVCSADLVFASGCRLQSLALVYREYHDEQFGYCKLRRSGKV